MVLAIFKLLDPVQTETVKQNALNTVNMLLMTQAPVIIENMQHYLNHIISMANDQSKTVRWRILQGIATILDFNPDIITENLSPVLDLMTLALRERDQQLATSSCDFWYILLSYEGSEESIVEAVRTRLPALLPLLLECCLYTEHDRM